MRSHSRMLNENRSSLSSLWLAWSPLPRTLNLKMATALAPDESPWALSPSPQGFHSTTAWCCKRDERISSTFTPLPDFWKTLQHSHQSHWGTLAPGPVSENSLSDEQLCSFLIRIFPSFWQTMKDSLQGKVCRRANRARHGFPKTDSQLLLWTREQLTG